MKSNKVLAFLLAFVALFAITVPTTVRADGGVEPPITPTTYEKLYFITDSSEYWGYERDIINSVGQRYGISSNNIIKVDFSQDSRREEPFHFFDDYDGSISSNSIVILEIQTRMKKECVSPCLISSVNHLKNAFSSLKEKNCKIMFISANDEDTLQSLNDNSPDYLEFLDYVDVHVNVDFMYMLAKGYIYQSCFEDDAVSIDSISNSCYFFDSNLCKPSLQSKYVDFMQKWFAPFLAEVCLPTYKEYIAETDDTDTDFWEYIYNANVRIYGQTYAGMNQVWDYLNGGTMSGIPGFTGTGINKSYVAALVDSSTDESVWLTMVNSLTTSSILTMVMYKELMNLGHLNLSPIYSVGETKFMFYGDETPYIGLYTFEDIVTAFIAGSDMTNFNNTDGGRCIITYTPVLTGPGGWIPSHLEYTNRSAQVYDNMEELEDYVALVPPLPGIV